MTGNASRLIGVSYQAYGVNLERRGNLEHNPDSLGVVPVEVQVARE
jgi:hypothetical protein